MRRICRRFLFGFALGAFILSLSTYAQEQDRGLSILGEAGLGYGMVSGQEFSESLSGNQYLLGGLLSFKTARFVFDGGMDWFYSKVSGSEARGLPVQVRTRAGRLELSPRYRLSDRWQLGLSYSLALGTDTGFAPAVGAQSSNSFIGLKAVYEIAQSNIPVRAFAQVSSDVSIGQRQAYWSWVGIQAGIPIRAKSASADDRILLQSSSAEKSTRYQDIEIVLDSQVVFFNTDSSKIRPEIKKALVDVGNYLNTHPEIWNRMEITGHADQRGNFAYNLKLSKRRANSVLGALAIDQKAGVAERVRWAGHSFSKPKDPSNHPSAWAKNRRVEVLLKDVEPSPELLSLLKPLSKLTPKNPIEQYR